MSKLLKLALLLCISLISFSLQADDKPVKIAVMGSESALGKEIDLLTVEFAKDESLTVLSRSEWTKLIREYEILKQDTASAYSKFGNLSGADALVILQQSNIKDKKDIIAKLVTTKTGLVLDAIVLPPLNSGEIGWIKGISKHFKRKLAKLANAPNDLKTVSLLNIRAETSIPELLELEKQINALFSYRLKRNENVLVTERQNMPEVLFEKYLNKGDESEFKTGKTIVGGTFNIQNGKVIINFQCKKPDGQIASFKIIEDKKNIAKIADQLTKKTLNAINSESGNTPDWNQQKEAKEYLDESIWAFNCGLYAKAARASEAAWALGCRDDRIHALRIISYANSATPGSLIPLGKHKCDQSAQEKGKLDQRLNAAITAIELFNIYLAPKIGQTPRKEEKKFIKEHLPFHLQGPGLIRFEEELLVAVTAPLITCFNQGVTLKDNPKISFLQKLIQKNIKQPYHYRSMYEKGVFARIFAYYVPYWYETIKEQQEVYLKLFQVCPQASIVQTAIWTTVIPRSKYRQVDNPVLFINWNRKMSPQEIDRQKQDFFNLMMKSKLPSLKFYGTIYKTASIPGKQEEKTRKIINKSYDEIRQGNIILGRETVRYMGKKLCNELYIKLAAELADGTKIPKRTFFCLELDNSTVTKTQKEQLLLIFHKLSTSQNKYNQYIAKRLNRELKLHDEKTNESINAKIILPKKGIYSSRLQKLTTFKNKMFFFYLTLVKGFEFPNNPEKRKHHLNIFSFSESNMNPSKISSIELPVGVSDFLASTLSVSDDYIVVSLESHVYCFDRKQKSWKKVVSTGTLIADTIIERDYLWLVSRMNASKAFFESNFQRINLKTKEITIISSSRSKIPKNILDGIPYSIQKIVGVDDNLLLLVPDTSSAPLTNLFIFNTKKQTFSKLKDMPPEFFKKHPLRTLTYPSETGVRQFTIFIMKGFKNNYIAFEIRNHKKLSSYAKKTIHSDNFLRIDRLYANIPTLDKNNLLFFGQINKNGISKDVLIVIGNEIKIIPISIQASAKSQKIAKEIGDSFRWTEIFNCQNLLIIRTGMTYKDAILTISKAEISKLTRKK